MGLFYFPELVNFVGLYLLCFFRSNFPALRTRYFSVSGGAATPRRPKPKNELIQLLRWAIFQD